MVSKFNIYQAIVINVPFVHARFRPQIFDDQIKKVFLRQLIKAKATMRPKRLIWQAEARF
jgi:hypothetical protein